MPLLYFFCFYRAHERLEFNEVNQISYVSIFCCCNMTSPLLKLNYVVIWIIFTLFNYFVWLPFLFSHYGAPVAKLLACLLGIWDVSLYNLCSCLFIYLFFLGRRGGLQKLNFLELKTEMAAPCFPQSIGYTILNCYKNWNNY